MPYSAGPNIAARPNLVFEYDLGDVANSYKGEPTTNYWNGNQFSIYNDGATNIRNSTDVAPPVPGYEVVKVTANNIGSYGQCILWNATYPNNNVATITNSIYAYLTVGDYVQVGQHWWPWYYGTQKAIPKNQWVRISETYTINEGNSYGNAALTYSTNGIAYFAMPQFEYVSHVTPFIGANQTRLNTQGLLDISGYNRTINLSSVSFTSTAQMTFDGTDDYIPSIGTAVIPAGSSPYTVSVWVNRGRNNVGYEELLAQWTNANSGNSFFFGFNNSNVRFSDSWNDVSVSGAGNTNVWMNLVGVNTGANAYIYLNGALAATKGSALTYTGTGPLIMGRQGELAGEYFLGRMNNVQIYNSALSAQQVLQNYNQLKTRFNIT